jgi:hypothetical protein
MFITYLIFFLPYLVPVLLILVAAVLAWKYFRTQDVGLLWLAVAVVVWPLVSRVIERRALLHFGNSVQGHPVGFFEFLMPANGQVSLGTLVVAFTLVQQFIGASLLLIAVFYLYKARGSATQL